MQDTKLTKSFVIQLQQFIAGGYKFDSGNRLRPGTQEEAVKGFADGLADGKAHGHFEIPTGVGKTATFISLISSYLKAAEAIKSGKRVLVVVPSTDLVIQTAKSFAKFMPEVAKTIEADDDAGTAIDWEKSQIGAQYSSLKHAPQKPKVLITTYQSLARDNEDKVYPPSEYGFVVYDEGHYITGERFSRSVQKFHDSIQLGVTATREYNEDKNVQQHLPHDYYRLPIKDAILRKDLCDVQPILVQTDFNIDREKFDKFVAENSGKPLTTKQKEALFNQKTRNQAILETYLLGKDKETGETYFGQTGLVFAAGVKHCADLKNQFNAMIKEEKYKPLKQWLDKEGIALVAEIHGKTQGEQLTIDGNKRYYTKDEIKELHRDGKILLLLSDQELKQGSDFPADSIIMDVVDRYSWVDAKQRYGRGYRLDPEDPDKVCKVFNFMDKNTKEIYGSSPEDLPIYCAETLEGVQFKKTPGRNAFKRFKEHPPEIETALAESNYELITDIARVKQVSVDYRKLRDSVDYPQKDDQHLTLGKEAYKVLGVSFYNPTYLKWKNDVEATIARGETAKVGDYPVIKMKCGPRAALCIDKAAIPTLAEQLGIELKAEQLGIELKTDLPEKDDKHLNLGKETHKALGVSFYNPTYLKWKNDVEATIARGETAKVGDYPVIKMKCGPRTALCIDKAAIPTLAEQLGIKLKTDLPEKDDQHLTLGSETHRLLGVRASNPTYLKWKNEVKAAIARGETAKVGDYPVIKMKCGPTAALCIDKDSVPELAKILAKMKTNAEVGGDEEVPFTGKAPRGTAKPDAITTQKQRRAGWSKSPEGE
ncbi:MAG: DEAD/DEAH box helicase [Alphaproteobacteria bacterium]